MDRCWKIAVFGVLVGCPYFAMAQDFDYHNPLVACYLTEAVVLGTKRCNDPSSTLVGAVFGACVREEQAAIEQHVAPSLGPYDRQIVIDTGIRTLRGKFAPVVQNWIAHAQIGGPDCLPK
jgi:hypothetical protein